MSSATHSPNPEPIVVLIGPTAIGKTALSIELAEKFDFEIISVDSMQVYRSMDIGTAKVTQEEMCGIPHHLIDVVDPDDSFDASSYERLGLQAIKDIQGRGRRVLLTGGTGLYLKALLQGLSSKIPAFPEIRKDLEQQLAKTGAHAMHKCLGVCDQISANRIHENDHHRLIRALEIFQGTGRPWSSFIREQQEEQMVRFSNVLQIGLTCPREMLYRRIEQRTEIMIGTGFEDEVRGLVSQGYGPELKSMQSIGYSHMLRFIAGDGDREKMTQRLTRDTRRYAKRQYTWFNKIDSLNWFDSKGRAQVPLTISRFLNR
jgi:tRNA dimethylallyltransferase